MQQFKALLVDLVRVCPPPVPNCYSLTALDHNWYLTAEHIHVHTTNLVRFNNLCFVVKVHSDISIEIVHLKL